MITKNKIKNSYYRFILRRIIRNLHKHFSEYVVFKDGIYEFSWSKSIDDIYVKK